MPTDLEGTVSWAELYDETVGRLQRGDVDGAEVCARRIVEEASGHHGAAFHVGLAELATERGVAALDRMVAERLDGRPLQYVVGSWGFRHLDLLVDERVLIPRPETEQVVEVALAAYDTTAGTSVVDLGTGSGAIGLAIVTERLDAMVTMTDRSELAVQVARANLAGVGRAAARATIRTGSWFDALDLADRNSFSLIVSNPPYVATTDVLPAVVRDWEPSDALLAGPDGFDDVEHLIEEAPNWLAPDGVLVVEMAPDQTTRAAELAAERGFDDVCVEPDLSGRDRMIVARNA